jgi:hypothetical protein
MPIRWCERISEPCSNGRTRSEGTWPLPWSSQADNVAYFCCFKESVPLIVSEVVMLVYSLTKKLILAKRLTTLLPSGISHKMSIVVIQQQRFSNYIKPLVRKGYIPDAQPLQSTPTADTVLPMWLKYPHRSRARSPLLELDHSGARQHGCCRVSCQSEWSKRETWLRANFRACIRSLQSYSWRSECDQVHSLASGLLTKFTLMFYSKVERYLIRWILTIIKY